MSVVQPSAAFSVNGTSFTDVKVIVVTKNTTVNLALDSVLGVGSVTWRVVGSNDSDLTNPTITRAGYPLGVTASFPMPDLDDVAFLVEAKINGGRDTAGAVDSSYTFRAIISTAASVDLVPFVYGETSERSPYGIVEKLNDAYSISQFSVSGFSLLGKTTTGAGSAESIVHATNTIPLRGSGDLAATAIAQNRIVGRSPTGSLGETVPNDFTFDLSSTSAKAGFRVVTDLTFIADASSDSTTTAVGGAGNYVFSVFVRGTDNSGGEYEADYTLRAKSNGSALSGAELAAPIALGTPTTGMDVTFSDNSGGFRVTVANSSGENYINARVCISWTFIPQPSAPV